jgi:hypothetical protein
MYHVRVLTGNTIYKSNSNCDLFSPPFFSLYFSLNRIVSTIVREDELIIIYRNLFTIKGGFKRHHKVRKLDVFKRFQYIIGIDSLPLRFSTYVIRPASPHNQCIINSQINGFELINFRQKMREITNPKKFLHKHEMI